MHEMAEDRIYGNRTGRVDAYVASGVGVVAVALSGDRVGRFRIDHRASARDVAADDGRLVVATDDDVLVGRTTDEADASDGPGGLDYAETGYGPAVAVGVDSGDVVAATPDGVIGRRVEDEWFEIAEVDGTVRAVDGNLVAASDGVYRTNPDGLDYVGLDDARDVAAAGPYAATGTGLYELGNGWIRTAEGAFDAVTASDDRAHVAGEAVLVRVDGRWVPTAADLPGPVAGMVHAGGTYAVTHDGTVLAHPGDGRENGSSPGGGWRTRALGVDDVGGIAVPRR